MKKKIFLLFLPVWIPAILFAQSNTVGKNESVAQATIVPSFSTNGIYSSRFSNILSFNVIVGKSENERGFAFGSIANIITNNTTGLQIAGICNHVKNEGKGVLISGIANFNSNTHQGVLLSGLFSSAREIKGLQLSGLLNKAEDIDGVQFSGLANWANNVSGVQIAGLVNIAKNSDIPIGLINIIGNGEYGIALTYNDFGSTLLTFRSGSKITYGILGLGYNHETKDNSFVGVGGLGANINVASWFRIKNELSIESILNFSDEKTFKAGYYLMPAIHFRHFEIFGGPSVCYFQTDNMANMDLLCKHPRWENVSTSKIQQVYYGFQFGVQYLF